MIKPVIVTLALASTLVAGTSAANAGEYYEGNTNNSNNTTVINNTTNNTVINNNRYGRGRYNGYKRHNPYYYNRPVYYPPSNQIQFRVPVKLNIFGSDINLNIDSQGYGYRH